MILCNEFHLVVILISTVCQMGTEAGKNCRCAGTMKFAGGQVREREQKPPSSLKDTFHTRHVGLLVRSGTLILAMLIWLSSERGTRSPSTIQGRSRDCPQSLARREPYGQGGGIITPNRSSRDLVAFISHLGL